MMCVSDLSPDYRLKLQAAEVRAKESEAKLGKLINAVKVRRCLSFFIRAHSPAGRPGDAGQGLPDGAQGKGRGRATRQRGRSRAAQRRRESQGDESCGCVVLLLSFSLWQENERKQKDRYDSAIASTTKKAEAAVERANKMEEKLGKLLEMMKGKWQIVLDSSG
jgi:hypothetical protein